MRKLLIIVILALSTEALSFAQLKKGEISIKFYIREEHYCAILNRAGWDNPKDIAICPVKDLSVYDMDNTLYAEKPAKAMYSIIFGNIQEYLKRNDNIYFEPCGRLFWINLAALMTPDGKRCCELYHFFRLSDIRAFPVDRIDKEGSLPQLALFGGMDYMADPEVMIKDCWFCHVSDFQKNYNDIRGYRLEDIYFGLSSEGERAGADNLRESKGEIKFIYYLPYPWKTVYTGSEALEELFRQATTMQGEYIMHVSTHAFTIVNDTGASISASEVYKRCGLLFSGAGHTLRGEKMPYKLNDGILFGEEIARLNMTYCNMIVLAACNTALGVMTDYGIIGLQSAFKRAGVHTMLMTLWSVNDAATSEFMKHFYSYLCEGKSKHQSLELARKELMSSKEFSDPVYWAPFIMLD